MSADPLLPQSTVRHVATPSDHDANDWKTFRSVPPSGPRSDGHSVFRHDIDQAPVPRSVKEIHAVFADPPPAENEIDVVVPLYWATRIE